ncbi:hypothetical protein Tsubulata_029482 [Turnera subulata]|uniref:Pentacotripeptide-repeat region of PRORP domain-containing protein n=1 Tax=Turnera subulata TaxID=218843 RepID=A0A9Q0GCI9_9ROSI|nr:hypothetical protein Tsubulata_029482 [Turnera subulata]
MDLNKITKFYDFGASPFTKTLGTARLVFENIPDKDVVSWSCLINAYSQQGSFHGSSLVMKMFGRMRDRDVFSGQQGFVSDGRKVFDEMPERNPVSWATMISGYADERMAKEALNVFEMMGREEEGFDKYVFTSVLSALADPQFVDIGRQIHCLAVKNGLFVVVSVLNALVTMYAKCRSLDDCLQVFELSSDKDAITWSAIVTGYAQSGDSRKALQLFSKMHFTGIDPSEYTLVGVLNACSDAGAVEEGKQVHDCLLKLGFEPQKYILTALVDMYAKCGCTADARKGFDYLEEHDIVLWTSMIAGYVQNGENEEALSLYGRMLMEGILPNELTMASVLKACSSLAALDQGHQIHALVVKYSLNQEVSIGSALATMYAKCGSLKEATLVFRKMPERDLISWNAMISGFSINGLGMEALELFQEMRQEGTRPDYITFVNILSACSHMGLVEKSWEYFTLMFEEFGIVPRLEHYACMVDVLSRAGQLKEAKEFIEAAKIDHGLCLWRILLSACRNHRSYELGAYAGEKLIEFGTQESSTYVMLSSIYKAMGSPEDAKRVWSLMKVRGVEKETGYSWIDFQSHVP